MGLKLQNFSGYYPRSPLFLTRGKNQKILGKIKKFFVIERKIRIRIYVNTYMLYISLDIFIVNSMAKSNLMMEYIHIYICVYIYLYVYLYICMYIEIYIICVHTYISIYI